MNNVLGKEGVRQVILEAQSRCNAAVRILFKDTNNWMRFKEHCRTSDNRIAVVERHNRADLVLVLRFDPVLFSTDHDDRVVMPGEEVRPHKKNNSLEAVLRFLGDGAVSANIIDESGGPVISGSANAPSQTNAFAAS